MIAVYGTRMSALPPLQTLLSSLPCAWLEAWKEAHPAALKNEEQARRSLGGLYLLQYADVRGTLRYEKHGRPYLAEKETDFNITHTKTHIFCAVTDGKGARVGLDAESLFHRAVSDRNALVARWFSDEERTAFALAPTQETFLRIWTRKEALVKYSGAGMRALRKTDTVLEERNSAVCFAEYRVDDLLVTLCHCPTDRPPKEIRILS